MLEQALADERQARQHGDDINNVLRRSVHRYINEVGRWRRRHIACAQQAQNLRTHYQQSKAEAELNEFNRAFVFNRYQKWKARELNSR